MRIYQNKTLLFTCLACFLLACAGFSQQGTRATVMVVPYTKSDEDMREKLENDFDYRVALSEIKRAFDLRGFTTIDFVEKLRNVSINDAAGMENWRDVFTTIIDNQPADIVVRTEIFIRDGGAYGNSVEVILEAIEKSSSESLANSGLLKGGPYRTKEYGKLIQKAFEKDNALEDFLNLMNEKFSLIRKNGRVIVFRVEVDQNSPWDLYTEVGNEGDYLSDKIIDWVKNKMIAWRENGQLEGGGYRLGGESELLLPFTQLRIPFYDEMQQRYDANTFSREARKFIRSLGRNSEKGEHFSIRQRIRGNVVQLSIVE